MSLGILAFDPPPCRPEKYVWTNGEVCIIAETAELAERHWVATMDRRYRGPAWEVAVHPICVEMPARIYVGGGVVPTVKLPRGWVETLPRWGGWLTGGQASAGTLPPVGGTLDDRPGRAR